MAKTPGGDHLLAASKTVFLILTPKAFSLSDDQDKSAFMAALGVKVILRLKFDDAMRQTSAEDFVTKVLPALGVQSLLRG